MAGPSNSAFFSEWRQAYRSALREPDTVQLFKLIEIAEAAILTRRDALLHASDMNQELQGMDEALSNLRILKKDRLKFAET